MNRRPEPRGFTARWKQQHAFMMERYAEHVVREIRGEPGLRSWFVGRPGTGMYSFRVVEHPGGLTIMGDSAPGRCGVNICYGIDWFIGKGRNAAPEAEYLASKSGLEQTQRRDLFDDWCVRELATTKSEALESREIWDDSPECLAAWEERREAIREVKSYGDEERWYDVYMALPQGDTDDGLPGHNYDPIAVGVLRAISDTMRRLIGGEA